MGLMSMFLGDPSSDMERGVDRALLGYGIGELANDTIFKSKKSKLEEALLQLQVLEKARSQGLDPNQAMDGDIISEDSPSDDYKTAGLLGTTAGKLAERPGTKSFLKTVLGARESAPHIPGGPTAGANTVGFLESLFGAKPGLAMARARRVPFRL